MTATQIMALAPFEAAVERTRRECVLNPMDPEKYRAHVKATRELSRKKLELLGKPCPNPKCLDGEVVIGWTRASLQVPPEAVYDKCYTCNGEGLVLPGVEWEGEE